MLHSAPNLNFLKIIGVVVFTGFHYRPISIKLLKMIWISLFIVCDAVTLVSNLMIQFLCWQIQRQCAAVLQPYFAANAVVAKCLEHGQTLEHVMDYTKLRALTSLFSMLNQAVRNVLNYNHNHPDFPMLVCRASLRIIWRFVIASELHSSAQ